MKKYNKLFTSESVGPGHPDKICDQISDAVLDAYVAIDPYARVACECFATKNLVVVGGEITSFAVVDIEKIVRQTLLNIGYDSQEMGIDANHCEVKVVISKQSADIALGVNQSTDTKDIGAGDQGLMFGYACEQTEDYMPLPIYLSHRLVEYADLKRKTGEFKWARPDMKSQVTIDYSNRKYPKVLTVLMSIQHDPDFDEVQFKKYVKDVIIKDTLQRYPLSDDFQILINPTGKFVIGGPEGDTGLTGRKIIVDTYGGYARHGGGAFSGKDCTKVDRSAAYMARYIAKNIVAAGLASEIEIQVAYAIGRSQPQSVSINCFDSETISEDLILQAIEETFDLTPSGIIKTLDLRKPVYQKTATYGHFGRNNLNHSWEKLDKVQELKKYLNK